MTPTIGDRIVDALVTACDASGKPDGTAVFAYGTRKAEEGRQIRIWPGREEVLPAPGRTASVIAERRLQVVAEIQVRQDGTAAPHTLVSPLYRWIVQAIKADETLGGLSVRIDELGWEDDAETRDKTYVKRAVAFEVLYDTDPVDPAAMPGEPPPDEGD